MNYKLFLSSLLFLLLLINISAQTEDEFAYNNLEKPTLSDTSASCNSTSANCSDCTLDDLSDVDTTGVGAAYVLTYAIGTSTWGAKSIGSLTGWIIDASSDWLYNDTDTLYFNDTKLDDEYVTYVDFNQQIYGSHNITTREYITFLGWLLQSEWRLLYYY